MQPLFLKPVFKERIWGGTALRDKFGYDIPSNRTGECWAISAHPSGPTEIENGQYAGFTLDQLWNKHPELFGYPTEKKFPLLTKILDANMDLSVQVHPNDDYDKKESKELGKTECWYIIDCKPNAELVLGHNAQSKDELINLINQGKWQKLLRRVKIKPGDFFYVPSGTIHALCEGTLVLETQQSSDTTFRFYDYGRRDEYGNLRELHLKQAIEVTTFPFQNTVRTPKIEEKEHVRITVFIESEFFTVYEWHVQGKAMFTYNEQYLLLSVIQGNGKLIHKGETNYLEKGTNLIIPVGFGSFEIEGSCKLIVSHT